MWSEEFRLKRVDPARLVKLKNTEFNRKSEFRYDPSCRKPLVPFHSRSRCNFLPHLWASLFLRAGRAESYSPASPSRNVQQITRAHRRGEVIIKFRDDAPKHLRDWVVANYSKGEKNCAGGGRRASSRSRTASIWPTPRST